VSVITKKYESNDKFFFEKFEIEQSCCAIVPNEKKVASTIGRLA